VGWPLLWNEFVIPRLLETGRIDPAEAAALDVIRRSRRTRPSEEREKTWADIYEFLLCHYPGHVMSIANERASISCPEYRRRRPSRCPRSSPGFHLA
jgi:hypothetical protein